MQRFCTLFIWLCVKVYAPHLKTLRDITVSRIGLDALPEVEPFYARGYTALMIFSKCYTFTKRTLGVLLTVGGLLGFAAIFAVDIIDIGREGGIGPAQRIALGVCVALTLIGLSLIPLGKAQA